MSSMTGAFLFIHVFTKGIITFTLVLGAKESPGIFLPLPLEEWWKGHLVLPLSIHLCLALVIVFKFIRWGHPCPVDTFLVFQKIPPPHTQKQYLGTP